MKDKTITIDAGFYTKTVNKGEFVDRWLRHFKQIGWMVDHSDSDQVLRYADCEMFVKELAEKEFDETYKLQNKKEAV
jgi:hypothetical protein